MAKKHTRVFLFTLLVLAAVFVLGMMTSAGAAEQLIIQLKSIVYDGQEHVLNNSIIQSVTDANGTPVGDLSGNEWNVSFSNQVITNVNDGPITVTVTVTVGNDAYSGTAELRMSPAPVTLTATSATGDNALVYNGQEQSVTGFTCSVDGLTFAESVQASGSGKDVNSYNVTFAGVTIGTTTDTTGNYVVSETINGTMTIKPATVIITWPEGDVSFTYNKTPQAPEATVTGLVNNETGITAVVSGAGTNVGTTYTATVTGLTGTGSGNYALPASGLTKEFSITAKAVTITDLTAVNREYDGTTAVALNGGTLDGICTGDDVSIDLQNATGTIENANASSDSKSVTVNGVSLTGVDAGNYSVSQPEGVTVLISPANLVEEGVITAYITSLKTSPDGQNVDQNTYVYDGTQKTPTALLSVNFNGSSTAVELAENTDFTVTYGENINAPEGTVKVTGKGNYTGEISITFTINRAPVTITADSATAFYDGDPFTYGLFTTDPEGLEEEFEVEMTADSTITDVGTKDNVIATVNGVTIPASGSADGTIVGNYLVKTVKGTLTVVPLPVVVVPDPNQSKKFGAADPELKYTLVLDAKKMTESVFAKPEEDLDPNTFTGQLEGALTRADADTSEKAGTYTILQGTLKCNSTGNLAVSVDESVKFTILPEFAGTVKVTNEALSTRTDTLKLTLAGITATLAKADQPIVKLVRDGVPAEVKISDVTVVKDGDYTITITGAAVTDAKSKMKYISYLPAGTYKLVMAIPLQEGDPKDFEVATVTIAADEIKTLEIKNSNADHDGRDLIGKETGDTIKFVMDKTFTTEKREWTAGKDQEIVQLVMTIDGKPVYDTDKFVEIKDLETVISEDLQKKLAEVTAESATVVITVKVVTPDLKAKEVSRTFRFDSAAKAVGTADFVDLTNRSYSFTVNLPELGKITALTIDGYTIDVSAITYTNNSTGMVGNQSGYGTSAKVTAAFSPEALPYSRGAKISMTYEDYAGNVYTYNSTDLTQASTTGIVFWNIEPHKEDDNDPTRSIVRATNEIRIHGSAVGYEKINLMLSADNGFRWGTSVIVPGKGEWNAEASEAWEIQIGDRRSELALNEQLGFPAGMPIRVNITYDDVNGGSYRTILIYDDVCQEAVLLSPTYPGMRVLTGYTEPSSTVVAHLAGGDVEAKVNPWGFFVIEFPEGVYDKSFQLEITDIAGNTVTMDVAVPGRVIDADTTVNVYPLGAMIQDDIGMVQFIATPVTIKDLEAGDIELPILAANYFKVGTMTLSMDAEGKITFKPVLDPAYAAEGAGVYFNIYAEQPAADALKPENRGEGLDIEQGYTPDAKVESFWFVYETQATLTEEQLTLGSGAETVDVNADAQFAAMQGQAE